MKRWKLFVVLLVALTILVLVLQNTASVEMELLFWTVVLPRALWILVAVLLGFVLGLVLAGRVHRTERKTLPPSETRTAARSTER